MNLALGLLLVVAFVEVAAGQDPAAFFQENCTLCHTIGGGSTVGPDLKDIHKRRDREWLVEFLQNPQAMVDKGDPVALQLQQEFQGIVMPTIEMSRTQAEALLRWIEEESTEIESKVGPPHAAGPVFSDRPLTAQDIAQGKEIFRGTRWLLNSGPAISLSPILQAGQAPYGLSLVVHFLYPEHLTQQLYPLLLLLGVLCGCGIATFSVGISQVSYWFPQNKQGRALAIFAGVGNLAPGLFSLLLPLALLALGLAGSYLAWLGLLIMGTILYWFLGRNAWYFQWREQGLSPDDAKQRAREQGQELFPARSLRESLKISAETWRTWALV